ncbi:MAG TPA: hypothetical protein VKA46_13350 [Gemmataceae bacterium]|nr:hypothetical protein [Gemmataceae bacterium]
MKTLLWVAVAALVVAAPVLVLAFAPAPDAGSRSVEYKTYNGYAESRDSGLKGDASFLAIPSRTEFTRVLTPVLTPRGTPDPVPKDAFDTQFFAAVIKRSDVLWDYKVEKVTANGDTLTINYRATPRKGGDSPRGETRRAGNGRSTRGATVKEVPAATQKADAPPITTERERPKTTEVVRDSPKERTTGRTSTSSATFDSPLLLSVPKDKYLSIVFIENGKKVGTARVGD